MATNYRTLLAIGGRPLRFAFVGGTSGAIQLALLHIATRHGWNAIIAEVVAIFVAAQINFLLNTTITWRDRYAGATGVTLRRRWLVFHGSIIGATLLNITVFAVAHTVIPALAASALGIAVAASINFFTFDRLVFRPVPTAVA
jgi:putative flippase GtrA